MIAMGMLLNDRYRLDSELGSGGMGVVYRAQDMLLERPVAVKVLNQGGLGSEGHSRLLQEAQAAAKLNHPNIVAIYDAGEVDSLAYIVMELVEGASLYEQRPKTIDEIIPIASQLCAALEHAHSHGIIHRDLKPENVMVTSDGIAKLMDFGLARSVASRLTMEGTIIGTVFYLAPEQALGKELDGRADLYALGAMLYEFCTGQLPFSGDDPFAIITQHLHAPVVPPRAKNDAIPVSLDALVVRLLSKDPDERPASAALVLEMLDEVASAPSRPQVEAPIELSLLDRIVRGRIVGREGELAEATVLWERARRGEGQLLLVSGEPGVGKTRLVREVVTRAEVSGSLALAGECYAEGGAPFAPFAQIVRGAVQDGSQGLDVPEFILADLLLLAPDLRLYYPDIPPNPSLDPQSDKVRLFENVVAFCQVLCQRTPLLLLLEDVHWADSGTLSLLHYLARRTRRLPLLLVATYRETDLDQTRPLQALLHELNRERLGNQLKLRRLDKTSTENMLAALFAEGITPDFLAGIYQETEGNPFFIEEVCKALVESGKLAYADGRWYRPEMSDLEIPQSIRVAIQSRASNLPVDAQEVLTLAAVLGRQFDYELLAAAGRLEENSLIRSLESAVQAQLIEEMSGARGGVFRFTHALIPPILRESLSGPRRRRYHRQVMAALEELRPDDLESLTHHALESGDLQKGYRYSLQAARKAHALYALDEALQHARHALDATEELDQVDQLVEIYELMGDILFLQGSYLPCAEAYQQALHLTEEPRQRVELNTKIGTTYIWAQDERGLEYLNTVVRDADPRTQSNELAHATALLGRFHHYRGLYRQAIKYLAEAQEIAEPFQDPLVLTSTYAAMAGAYQHLSEFDNSIAWARRLTELGERHNYPLAIALGYEFQAECFTFMGFWSDTLQYGGKNRAIGIKIGAQHRIGWADYSLAVAYFGMGDLSRAEELAQNSLDLADRIQDNRLQVLSESQLAVILADRGNHQAARTYAKRAQQRGEKLGDISMVGTGNQALAYCYAMNGDWTAAGQLMDAVAVALKRSDTLMVPLLYFGFYSQVTLESGDLEKAEGIAGGNLTLAREAQSPHYEAEALRVLAQLRSVQGQREPAKELLDQAIQIFERLGSRLELGKAFYYYGKAQIEWEEPQAARQSLDRAAHIFEDCQAVHWIQITGDLSSEIKRKGHEG